MGGIEIANLTKSYGDKVVLDRIHLTLLPGSASALMAPSGAGKTTLLRILAGLEAPDAGEVRGLDGLRVSMQFQDDRLLGYAGALENLRFALPRSVPAAEQRALLTALLPGAPLEQPVSEYSGGMRRRVALARAILAPSELLLLDEPFTGLDDDARRLAARVLRDHLRGRTLLLTTHDAQEAELCGAAIVSLSRP